MPREFSVSPTSTIIGIWFAVSLNTACGICHFPGGSYEEATVCWSFYYRDFIPGAIWIWPGHDVELLHYATVRDANDRTQYHADRGKQPFDRPPGLSESACRPHHRSL